MQRSTKLQFFTFKDTPKTAWLSVIIIVSFAVLAISALHFGSGSVALLITSLFILASTIVLFTTRMLFSITIILATLITFTSIHIPYSITSSQDKYDHSYGWPFAFYSQMVDEDTIRAACERRSSTKGICDGVDNDLPRPTSFQPITSDTHGVEATRDIDWGWFALTFICWFSISATLIYGLRWVAHHRMASILQKYF